MKTVKNPIVKAVTQAIHDNSDKWITRLPGRFSNPRSVRGAHRQSKFSTGVLLDKTVMRLHMLNRLAGWTLIELNTVKS